MKRKKEKNERRVNLVLCVLSVRWCFDNVVIHINQAIEATYFCHFWFWCIRYVTWSWLVEKPSRFCPEAVVSLFFTNQNAAFVGEKKDEKKHPCRPTLSVLDPLADPSPTRLKSSRGPRNTYTHLPWSSRGIKLKLATHNAVEPIYEFVPNLYNKISPPPSDSHKIKKKHLKDNEQERSRDFIKERGGRKGRGREGEDFRLEFRRSFCKLAYTAALPCVPAGSYSCSDMASELHSSLRVSLNSNFRNSFGYAFHIFVCIFSVEPHLHTHLYG